MANLYLGEFEQLVLLALLRLDQNAYGVTVRREIQQKTGRNVSLGTVYKTLGRLETKGYIASRTGKPIPERGGRRKKFYRIGPLGNRALNHSLHTLRQMTKGLGKKIEAL